MARDRNHRWLVGLAVLLVGGLAIVVVPGVRSMIEPVTQSLGSLHIQVVGRVVDAKTGQPLQDATVYALGSAEPARAEEEFEEMRTSIAELPDLEHSYWIGRYTSTDADGRFDLILENTYCITSGPGITEEEPEAFYGARTVAVEADGYELTLFAIAKSGTWRVLNPRRHNTPYGIVDARTLQLPPAN